MAAGFDVTTEVPVAVCSVCALGPDDHVLVLVVHHISADGFSMAPLTRDVMIGVYGARAAERHPAWAPLAVQYADYALWQREVLGAEDDPESLAARQLAYWRDSSRACRTSSICPPIGRVPASATNRGAPTSRSAPTHGRARLDVAGRTPGTLFMVVHAASRGAAGPAERVPRHRVGTAGRGPWRAGTRRRGRHVRQHPGAAHGR